MFENREGQRVPSVVFKTRQNNEWVDVKSDDIFNGRTVAVFSLPGAYGMAMASNYNTRPRAVEVMVDGDAVHVIRQRETVAQLYAGEQVLPV